MPGWKLVDEQTWAEIDALGREIQRFLDGQMSMDELRPLRPLYGVYGQRHKDRYMLRAGRVLGAGAVGARLWLTLSGKALRLRLPAIVWGVRLKPDPSVEWELAPCGDRSVGA